MVYYLIIYFSFSLRKNNKQKVFKVRWGKHQRVTIKRKLLLSIIWTLSKNIIETIEKQSGNIQFKNNTMIHYLADFIGLMI